MLYRTFGATELKVSAVCLGCWGMGGEFYGPVDDEESVRTIHAAEDAGINFLDTAVVYGSGRSERVVGQALGGARRARWIVASKCGRRALPDGSKTTDGSRQWLLRDLETSLRQLNMDYIDVYQLHHPDPNVPLAESMAAMVQMQQAGKIRHIGVSNVTVAQLEECRKVAQVVSVQPQYSMFQRQIEADLLPYCRRENIATMVFCPLARGLLTGKFTGGEQITDEARRNWKFFKGANFAKSVAIVDRLKEVARDIGITVAQLAVAWAVNQPGITVAICGAKQPDQIHETATGAEIRLTASRLKQIETILADVAKIQ